MKVYCETIIQLLKTKERLIQISYNPPVCLSEDGSINGFTHEISRLPDGSSLSDKLIEIDKAIAKISEEMYLATKQINEDE